MRRINKVALGIFFAFYIGFGILITLNQEKIIYQPWMQDFDLCVAFSVAEKAIHNGTRMYVEKGGLGVVVLYHGNAGSACDRDFYAQIFKSAGYGYIIPEYAGYSNDIVSPSHERVKQDVENVVSYILENYVDTEIFVVGESVGTGIASYHVSISSPDKLFLISPFYSLADIAGGRFWFYPTILLVDNAFDNDVLLEEYTGPVVIMHGDVDNIIPQESGKKLFESLISKEKEFISIEGYGHNNLFSSVESYDVVRAFLK